MSKYLQVVVDNVTTFVGLLTAIFGLLAAFGVELTSEQVGAITTVFGLAVIVLGLFLTVAKRQVVSLVDRSGVIRAGQASVEPTGSRTPVDVDPVGNLVPQVAVKPELLDAA